MEIERRFLVKKLPDGFHLLEGKEILQGYLGVTADAKVLRLRRKGGRLFFTVKTGKGLIRNSSPGFLKEATDRIPGQVNSFLLNFFYI